MKQFCGNCGTEIPENAQVCPNCNSPVVTVGGAGTSANVGGAPTQRPYQQETQQQGYQQQGQGYQQPAYQQAPYQQQGQGYQQPVYTEPPKDSPYAVMTIGDYLIITLLMCIPLVNIILLIVWATGGAKKKSQVNYARASLIVSAISMVLGVIFATLIGGIIAAFVANYAGTSDVYDGLYDNGAYYNESTFNYDDYDYSTYMEDYQ